MTFPQSLSSSPRSSTINAVRKSSFKFVLVVNGEMGADYTIFCSTFITFHMSLHIFLLFTLIFGFFGNSGIFTRI